MPTVPFGPEATRNPSMQNRTDTPASALWAASYVGDLPAVSRLISEGVDVNVWDQQGRSALVFAAMGGHLEVAERLLRASAWVDPHEDYDVYDSPLMHAAVRGDRVLVELLLRAGADPTQHVGRSQQTAENYARGGHPEIAALLRQAEDKKRASNRKC